MAGVSTLQPTSLSIRRLVRPCRYGDSTRGVRAGLQVSPATYNLFMVNGCVENGGWYYNL